MTNPYQQLGVSTNDTDDTIRTAYLQALKTCPPERDRQRFEQIRAAYEEIATLEKRMAYDLFNLKPPTVDDVLSTVCANWQPKPPSLALLTDLLTAPVRAP
jgi:curved DNA-binding protein CbpA